MRIGKVVPVVLTMFFVISCGTKPVNFNPDFWNSDYKNSQIISERGDTISCDSPAFNDFAAMSGDKIKELRDILDDAVVPKGLKWLKKKYIKQLNRVIKKLEKKAET